MALSPEYLGLCKRIAELRRNLLPAAFDPLGNYAPDVLDNARGFVALAHAEIEAFLEERCLIVAKESVSRWMASRASSRVTFALFAICYTGWTEIGGRADDLPKLTDEQKVEARLGTALKQYQHVVDNNHGIKEDNLKKLLVPLSIRLVGDLDMTWLNNMSSFGTDRGRIVHQRWSANQPPDPKGALRTLWKEIVPGLRHLDKVLTALL